MRTDAERNEHPQ